MRRLLATLPVLLLLGCLAPGTSDAPRVWNLPDPEHRGAPVRVFLPLELRTPRVVAGDIAGAPVARDFDRWGRPLAGSLGGLISGHLLAGLPLREAVVEFRTLRVDASGRFRAAGSYRLTTFSLPDGPDREIEGTFDLFLLARSGDSGPGSDRERIVDAYAGVAKAVADDMRGDVEREAQGEIANPAAPSTVPTK